MCMSYVQFSVAISGRGPGGEGVESVVEAFFFFFFWGGGGGGFFYPGDWMHVQELYLLSLTFIPAQTTCTLRVVSPPCINTFL